MEKRILSVNNIINNRTEYRMFDFYFNLNVYSLKHTVVLTTEIKTIFTIRVIRENSHHFL